MRSTTHPSIWSRRISRRAGVRLGSLGVAGGAAWLAACGGGGDDGADTASGGPSSTRAATPAGNPPRLSS